LVSNLTAAKLHLFITSDFKGAWDSIAANKNTRIGRGNFMFGRQAMNLLEFAARLCSGDVTGKALTAFSRELKKIEPKYFTALPSPCPAPSDFILPHDGNADGNLLLWALFDLMRHGLAHQYQQIIATLTDGKRFYIQLTGAEIGRSLSTVRRKQRPDVHLAYFVDSDGDIGLKVLPDILFIDFEKAIKKSGLLASQISFNHLSRPRTHSRFRSGASGPYYNFNSASLQRSLASAGHRRL